MKTLILKSYQAILRILNGDVKYLKEAYSQEGEDLLLQRFFGSMKTGFYVDIGAHHPKRFSNTYLLHRKGWRGMNVDAAPGSMKAFIKQRPNDINLEIGVAQNEGELSFYMFNEPALNTFDSSVLERVKADPAYHLIETQTVKTMPLSKVFKQHLPPDVKIDYLNIDVEGLDMEVLSSNNWELYRPKILSVEEKHKMPLEEFMSGEVFKFMNVNGYQLMSKTILTHFFIDGGNF
jgi:FkbM family methyltransferase